MRLGVACLVAVGCGAGGGAGSDAGGDAGAAAALADTPALRAHVLSRAGYGPDAWSRQRIAELGTDAYLEEQLDPDSVLDESLEAVLAIHLPALTQSYFELRDPMRKGLAPTVELTFAKLLRAVMSRRQLEQVLTDFWFNHFNVDASRGGAIGPGVGPYERDAIRAHVLGRFPLMLAAVARSPAMLDYLDNAVSTREGVVLDGRVRGLNENYARELLELHTVGVDGGYDQDDVIEVARAFTGWTISERPAATPDGFEFRLVAHDYGAKSIMGELFLPAGRTFEDGFDVIVFLASHPKTAARVCRRLAQRFVADDPPESLVSDCAAVYLASGGDLRRVTRSILFSREFRGLAHRGTKLKRPTLLVASLLRAVPTPLTPELMERLLEFLRLMGEDPYKARAPVGYPNHSRHWAGGGAFVGRLNLVEAIVAPERGFALDEAFAVGSGPTEELVDALSELLLPLPASARTRAETIRHVEGLGAVDDVTRAREAANLLLSSPEFQRH